MPYTMLHDRFAEMAGKETRTLTVLNDPDLPPDNYVLTELYCDEPECDCRRVMLNVYARKFKYLFDYGDELLHTLEVLDIYDRTNDQVEYPRITEKIGDPPPQYEYSEE